MTQGNQNGTWEVRMPGATEFVPVPATDQMTAISGRPAFVPPPGAAGAEYRFRDSQGRVGYTQRLNHDLPPVTRRGRVDGL